MEKSDDSIEVEFVVAVILRWPQHGCLRSILEHTGDSQAISTATLHLTANQQYSTATQLRLMHKKYKRED